MFVNFTNVLQTTRKKPPFGIAQIGKSFRNEITPGNFVFRTREFEQMEMEFFVPPDEAPAVVRVLVPRADGLVRRPRHARADQLRLRPHDADELSHYSSGTSDVEFLFPWGWDELEGIAHRDATSTSPRTPPRRASSLEYFDQASQRALRAPRDRAGGRGAPARRWRSSWPPTTRRR